MRLIPLAFVHRERVFGTNAARVQRGPRNCRRCRPRRHRPRCRHNTRRLVRLGALIRRAIPRVVIAETMACGEEC